MSMNLDNFLNLAGAEVDGQTGAYALFLPNYGALLNYEGDQTGLFIFCHTQAGMGGGWFDRIDGDTDTPADGGMTARDKLNRLWRRPIETEVSPQTYGAVMDAGHDDSAAIEAADAYCAANGRTFYLRGGIGYKFAGGQEYVWKSRHILGEMSGTDQIGTNIIYAPSVAIASGKKDIPTDATKDMMGCMTLGTPGFLVENVNIEGLGGGSTDLVADGYITAPATLPKYSAFAPGFAAFKVTGGATGKFRNCKSGRIKVGLYLESTDGHVMWDDCDWHGIFGIYCKINSGDYFGFGGGASGDFAGVVFGNSDWAGHSGGMEISWLRAHFGFCPYPFYQVDDAATDKTGQFVGGLSGTFYSCSFEEVGECAIKTLPLSQNALLMTHTGSAFAPASDAVYRLPASLAPAAGVQQYWMDLGMVTALETLHCTFDASPYATAPNPAALRVTALAPSGFGSGGNNGVNLDAFSTVVFGANDGSAGMPAGVYPKSNDAYPPLARGLVAAYKDDFRLTKSVLPVGNLLPNPEQITAALGSANNVLAANGGNIQPYQCAATLNTLSGWQALSTPEFTGFTFPRGFYEELGANPKIMKVSNASGFTDCGIQLFFPTMAAEPNRLLYMSAWIAVKGPAAGATANARLYIGDNSGNNVFDTTEYFDTPLVWRRIRWVANKNSTGVYNKWNASIHNLLGTTGAMYFAGLMCNWDEAAPYNPYPAPMVNGTLYLENQVTQTNVGAAGTASALPTKPTLYVVEYIGGKKYVSPRYLAS